MSKIRLILFCLLAIFILFCLLMYCIFQTYYFYQVKLINNNIVQILILDFFDHIHGDIQNIKWTNNDAIITFYKNSIK